MSKLHTLISKLTLNEAVRLYNNGDRNIVVNYNDEYYSVNNFCVFDKHGVDFYYINYQRIDVIKLLDSIRLGGNTEELISSLSYGDTFTSMVPSSLI